MSRGGRGGARGGRGGGGAGRSKIGLDVPGYDPEVEKFLSWEPLEQFPAINLPKPLTPSRVEKRQIALYRSLRSQVHEGPLYTVFGTHAHANTAREKRVPRITQAASFDPFQGTPTLSDKFKKQHRRIPKLDTRPYVMRFFPKELWITLDPKFDETVDGADGSGKGRRKVLKIGKTRGDILEELERAERRFKLENPDADDEDLEEDLEEEEDEKIEEEQDTDYEEDEDDDNDYNAQGYWEDMEYGDDAAGDDYDDGGGGGVYD